MSRIVAEAARESIPLSDIERKILYHSETGWTLPDMMEVNQAFDREYNQEEYERKIARIIQNLRANARVNGQAEFDAWTEAVRRISREDHYLLVLISKAGSTRGSRKFVALAAAFVVALVILVFSFFNK